jgi:hypothetical protein
MKQTIIRSLAVAMMLGVVALTGCEPPAQREGPPTYPVSGAVTQDGEAVVGATVRFELADGSQTSIGKTDDSGKYELSTYAAADGALAGEYKVTVTKDQAIGGAEAVAEDDPNYTGEEADVKYENVLPAKYASAETSELTATVTETGCILDIPIVAE